ncbi:MAG: ABC transporter permease [Candidatus Obscuribacterales bacterium]|nr:ABC transporter permease [Candidatus Obscuribacterales bacterium]
MWLTIFMVVPLVILLVFSVGHRDDLGRVALTELSLENYMRFFSGPYLLTLFRSMTLAAMTTIVCLVLGTLTATWMAFSVPAKYKGLLMTLFVLPLWTSFLLRIYAWITILRPTGIMSDLLSAFGWQNPPFLLYSPYAVLLGMVYNYLPYMVLPVYAALEKLDVRLIEAAADLGATPLNTFFKVIVPLSSRGLIAGSIMVFVPALGDYVTPDLLGGGKTMFIGNLIQNQFLAVRDWAFGCAVSTLLIIIVAMAIWVYLKYGETETIKA